MPAPSVVLGRSMKSDIQILHGSVSRRHARVEKTDDGYLLSDLGSHNGTYYSGKRLAEGEKVGLSPGCSFRLGSITIVLATDEPIAT